MTRRVADDSGRLRKEPEPAKLEPTVPVRRSIRTITSSAWSAASSRKTLRRHLDVAHQLTPEAHREQFGLKPDYPMAAPGYSRQRSEMAKRVGLGQRVQAPSRRRRPRSGACPFDELANTIAGESRPHR